MEINYAIEHCHEKAEELKSTAKLGRGNSNPFAPLPEECLECAKEHEQLAKWLEELKEARGKLKAIEDIAREIFNRPNTENTRVILKRALTDILDISKSGEEV